MLATPLALLMATNAIKGEAARKLTKAGTTDDGRNQSYWSPQLRLSENTVPFKMYPEKSFAFPPKFGLEWPSMSLEPCTLPLLSSTQPMHSSVCNCTLYNDVAVHYLFHTQSGTHTRNHMCTHTTEA